MRILKRMLRVYIQTWEFHSGGSAAAGKWK